MDYPYPLIVFLLLLLLFQLPGSTVIAQSVTVKKKDSVVQSSRKNITDSVRSLSDTLIKGSKQLLKVKKQEVTENIKATLRKPGAMLAGIKNLKKDSNLLKTPSLQFDINNPFKKLLKTGPAFRLNEGFISYDLGYRSNIDTPYVEKDITQHNVLARLNVTVAGFIPLQVMYRGRQSNSGFFRDISDVQVSFNGADFQNQLQGSVRDRLLALAPSLRDSLTEKLYQLKSLEALKQRDWLKNPLQLQSLIEANQILRVPEITYDYSLPDSTNIKRSDSMRKAAAAFIELYNNTKGQFDKLNGQIDSLKKKYDSSMARIGQYRRMINGQWKELTSYRQWKNKLSAYNLDNVELPAKYRWLMGVRHFSVGRSQVNYSELSAKNISINGVSLEYNSWYYFAVTAGVVDYRFRDFVVNRFNKTPQTLYMIRAGIGRLEDNHFIVSGYKGRKQLFAGSPGRAGLSTINIWGIGAEGRLQLNRNTHIIAEVAESISPDYRSSPPRDNTKFSLSDKSNKALSLKIYSYVPQTKTRIEGLYKYTGANFQSFSSFQTNAALKTWYIKADQQFFKRQLRVSASLRSNEFSNPYLIQDYKSNTVFKTITATMRVRKWPVVSVGYLPMSQLTVLDDRTLESRFQTLNASLFHQYKIKGLRTSTMLMYNRFYNNSTDTGFIYYNAINIYGAQSFFFERFTVNAALSHTKNSSYQLNVLDGGVQLHVLKWAGVGFGVKINNFDQQVTKTGGYMNASIRITSEDILYVSYEHGYLPGYNKGLIRSELANIQFTKTFRFR